jgi:phenylacetic acid degradation protein PaaD
MSGSVPAMGDPFMKALGLEAEIPGPGQARVWGVVRPEHLNLHGTAHGGFLYTLADAAFALASNSHGVRAVALSTHMEYLRAVQAGERVEAVADGGLSRPPGRPLPGGGAAGRRAGGRVHRMGSPVCGVGAAREAAPVSFLAAGL